MKDFLEVKRQCLLRVFNKMNPMQQRAVFQTKGPVLILAGAGSGKTTVLVNRVANLIRFGDAYHTDYVPQLSGEDEDFLRAFADGSTQDLDRLSDLIGHDRARPWNVLAITFTNKAAGELRARLEGMLGEQASDVMAATFHSACVRILRREAARLGYTSSFTIYDTDDCQRVVKEALKALNKDEKNFPPKAVLGAISRAKDGLCDPEAFAQMAGSDYRLGVIAKIYAQYQQTLRSADAMDFDDLIMQTVRLFQQEPDVLAHYRARYRYIMVDEYQDTNHAQYMLVSLLAGEHQNLCVVGDDDQSIYKFRGATIENILNFEHQFPQATVIRLEQNYRSTQKILDAANAVIAHNTQRKGKNLWTDQGEGAKIHVYRAVDEQGEGQYIAEAILENVRKGGAYRDNAVLYRMNAQSNMIERALVKSGIPYRIVGGLRFFERKEVKDVLAYLAVLQNPSDSVRLQRIINEPKRGIGAATLATAQQLAAELGVPVFDIIAEADSYAALQKKSKPLLEFASTMRQLMQTADEEPLEVLFDQVLERTGYLQALQAQGFEGQTRIENIEELRSNIVKYEQEEPDGDLAGFLEEVALYTDMDRTDLNDDCVILMTLHSAKGLEFPNVFIAGFEEGIFPGMMSISSPDEIEEERRLAYVGITRAKQQLTITTAAQRLLFGQTLRNRASRFVGEIPKELCDFEDATLIRAHVAPAFAVPPGRRAGGAAPGAHAVQRPVAAAAPADLKIGDHVTHKVFGQGVIYNVTPMGGDLMVEVAFDRVGTKKLMANFARLQKV